MQEKEKEREKTRRKSRREGEGEERGEAGGRRDREGGGRSHGAVVETKVEVVAKLWRWMATISPRGEDHRLILFYILIILYKI